MPVRVFCMHLCKRPNACVRACVSGCFGGLEGGGWRVVVGEPCAHKTLRLETF